MWVARFKLKDEEDIYSPLCVKHRVEFYAYPVTHFIKNEKVNLIVAGNIYGKEEAKQNFVRGLNTDRRVKLVERYKDFILVHASHPLTRETLTEITTFYDPMYIPIKPVHVASDGWEYWEVACLDREKLNKLVRAAQKHYNGKILSIRQEKLAYISTIHLFPKLTDKQRQALELAFKEGYYEYPKKITIEKLAEIAGVSYSTFQEHLKKAERKIIEAFLKLV